MTATDTSKRRSARIKLFYGVGDLSSVMVNSTIQFFLLVFCTDGALITPALAKSSVGGQDDGRVRQSVMRGM